MPQPDQNTTAENEFELTAAETAALNSNDSTQANPATSDDAGAPPSVSGDAVVTAGDSQAQESGETAGATESEAGVAAGVTDAQDQPVHSANPSPVFVPTYKPAARDFDAESQQLAASIKALREKYRGGDIEDDAYEQLFDDLQQQRTQLEVAKATAQLQESMSRDNAEQAWQFAQRQFLSIPENRGIAGNPLLEAAWGAALQHAVNTSTASGQTLDDWALMQAARDVMVSGGLLASAAARPDPAGSATHPPKPDRMPPLANVPTSLTSVPASAEASDRPAAEAYSDVGIEDLEGRMSKMSDTDRESLLRSTPGMFLNNQ